MFSPIRFDKKNQVIAEPSEKDHDLSEVEQSKRVAPSFDNLKLTDALQRFDKEHLDTVNNIFLILCPARGLIKLTQAFLTQDSIFDNLHRIDSSEKFKDSFLWTFYYYYTENGYYKQISYTLYLCKTLQLLYGNAGPAVSKELTEEKHDQLSQFFKRAINAGTL